MSDDDAEIRRSPKKHKRSVLPSDAAKNIIKNKDPKNSKNANPKKRSDKETTEVGKNDNGPKKTKASNALGITNESDEFDGDNFEPDAGKKAIPYTINLRNEWRKDPEKILAAQKKKMPKSGI